MSSRAHSISFIKPYSFFARLPLGDWAFNIALLFLGVVVLALLIIIKSHSMSSLYISPWFIAYTLFVTIFQLSRVMAVILYKRSYNSVLADAQNVRADAYEPTVSFIIPCYNEETVIEHTIRACFAVNYPQSKIEVIAVNDGSLDRTGDILKELKQTFPQLVFIDWKENKGKRAGMTAGFYAASGEIVIQLDSDSYVAPSAVRKLVTPFAVPYIGAVCAHTDPSNPNTNTMTRMQAAYYFVAFRVLKAAESAFSTVFCCSGCCSAYRRAIIMPILAMWYRETFLGLPVTWGDDRGLTNWVLKLGYRTIYAHDVQAYTAVPETLKQFLKQQVRWKKGWFVNSIFASKFILKRDAFVALTYFFPLIFVTITTPFMAVRAFVYSPIVNGTTPLFYIMGVLLIAISFILVYRYLARHNQYWPYVFVWSIINMFILSFILLYALFRLNDRRWGTRGPGKSTVQV